MTAQTTSNINIQQLNLGYNLEQDRLLFRVGLSDNSEVQVWLTQRIARQLWQALGGKTHLPTAHSIEPQALPQQALQQFEQEVKAVESLQKMDFKTEYQAREKVQNDGALLATQLSLENENSAAPILHLTCIEGLMVNINLNAEMMLAICNMLQLSCKESHWDLGVSASASPTAPPSMLVEAEKVLH